MEDKIQTHKLSNKKEQKSSLTINEMLKCRPQVRKNRRKEEEGGALNGH